MVATSIWAIIVQVEGYIDRNIPLSPHFLNDLWKKGIYLFIAQGI
jgi:hypothetical protein